MPGVARVDPPFSTLARRRHLPSCRCWSCSASPSRAASRRCADGRPVTDPVAPAPRPRGCTRRRQVAAAPAARQQQPRQCRREHHLGEPGERSEPRPEAARTGEAQRVRDRGPDDRDHEHGQPPGQCSHRRAHRLRRNRQRQQPGRTDRDGRDAPTSRPALTSASGGRPGVGRAEST